MWKVVSASVRGTSHVGNDTPCQDASAWRSGDGWFVGVVSDGAGSATNSEHGARHCAHVIVDMVSELFMKEQKTPEIGIDELKEWVVDAIRVARDTVNEGFEEQEVFLEDFHATVVGVIINSGSGLFFHIGDGAAVGVINEEWDTEYISPPENGEYANETFFYTENNWKQHLRYTEVSTDIDLIVLMSDGAMSFTMTRGASGLDEKFISPVTKYLNNVDTEQGNRALAATLDNPKTYSITSDDKTILWARRVV